MSRREDTRRRREHSERLRAHLLSRVHLPESLEFQLKIDCLASRHYAPDSEQARAYIEKAKKYTMEQRLHFIRLYLKQYDEFLHRGFSMDEGENKK